MKLANQAWIQSLHDVMTKGKLSSPRGFGTKEIMNYTTQFDMNYPICRHPKRKLSYKFMAAEAYWITSGSPLVEDIAPYNKHIAKYSDDEYIFNGAYGPAFLNQLNYIVETLNRDRNTRQAVMTIWHPNPIKSKDQKCTVSLVFNIRNHKLHTTVLMRSNDLILGRPYDYFNFTVMTLRVLTLLNESDAIFTLGTLTLHAVSAHVYEDKFEMAYNIIYNPVDNMSIKSMPKKCYTDWQYVVDSLLACRDDVYTKDLWEIRHENSLIN